MTVVKGFVKVSLQTLFKSIYCSKFCLTRHDLSNCKVIYVISISFEHKNPVKLLEDIVVFLKL